VQLDELSKGKVKAEREAALLRHRAEAAEVKMAKGEKEGKELAGLRAQKVKLEKLCRTLQTERSGHLAQVKALEAQLLSSQQGEGGDPSGAAASSSSDRLERVD
jgi:hypothetical protein